MVWLGLVLLQVGREHSRAGRRREELDEILPILQENKNQMLYVRALTSINYCLFSYHKVVVYLSCSDESLLA